MRALTGFMLRAAAVAAFASALAPQAVAQDARVIEATRKERERRAGEEAQRLASWELRLLEQRKQPQQRRDLNLAWAQIREDYRQLQVVNNELARAVSGGGALDLRHVAKSASEIRKRAARLRENMVLPEPEKQAGEPKPEAGAEAERLKSSLTTLDKLILDFVNNPIFERTRTADVQMSAKARQDLDGIIELSEQIRKSSERLSKGARK
ncbi:MAG TPA: hypothetical protein VN228_21390 [Pyrinomonadaceae bacterium]|nr:hypothetical protein [Pyrinomonadaceae bacterium]